MISDPEFLYRYYRFDEYTEKIFTNNEIYFQIPSKFNDPFDSRIAFVLNGTEEEKQRFLQRNLPLARPDLTEQEINEISSKPSNIKKFFDDFCRRQSKRPDELGIYCLTNLKDNILMWAHYSDNHKGFCLEFDYQNDEFFQEALPVEYSETRPTFNELDITIGESNKFANKFAELLLIKAEDWKYEDEWRLVYTPDRGGPGIHTFPENLLTGVILGFQIASENRDKIIRWCSNRKFNPKIYQTKPKKTEFGLDVIPI